MLKATHRVNKIEKNNNFMTVLWVYPKIETDRSSEKLSPLYISFENTFLYKVFRLYHFIRINNFHKAFKSAFSPKFKIEAKMMEQWICLINTELEIGG